jgi:hypothetical protein
LAVIELEVLLPEGRFTAGDGQSAVIRERGPERYEGRIHHDKERRDVCVTRALRLTDVIRLDLELLTCEHVDLFLIVRLPLGITEFDGMHAGSQLKLF